MARTKTPRHFGLAGPRRHVKPFDRWSIVHVVTGVLMGWVMRPFIALSIMVLWEPLELFVLSPVLGRFGIVFGDESLRNSLSDIFFDVAGVALGAWLLAHLFTPPFHLL